MLTLILGDIHGNLEAFQAVLKHAQAHGGFEQLWCLGDTVGYGPDPGPCIDLLRQYAPLNVAGNHDYASVGQADLNMFNPAAAFACRWTAKNLSESQTSYLKGLPLTLRQGAFTMAHGSLRDPLWEYLLNTEAAEATFRLLTTPRCLVSHSHVPFLCADAPQGPIFLSPPEAAPVALNNEPVILNPGAVGQPRDGDPRASYLFYDDAGPSVTLHRVEYDIQATQKKMAQAKLPEPLISRLAHGR
ncbi:MAG: metallophosphoesterase family protein [Chloroflexi bacterium]|nr:metallophosphoesterase family protein [Chloroflexota bacterium]